MIKIITSPDTIEIIGGNTCNKWSSGSSALDRVSLLPGALSHSLKDRPSKHVARGLHPRKPGGSVCASHLNLWLRDTQLFWTEHLATPLLKYVKGHALISLEMEIHRLFLKATATQGQIDSIHPFSWKWCLKGMVSCLYLPKEIYVSFRCWGPWRDRSLFIPWCFSSDKNLWSFSLKSEATAVGLFKAQTERPSTLWLVGNSLLGIRADFFPRSAMTGTETYDTTV